MEKSIGVVALVVLLSLVPWSDQTVAESAPDPLLTVKQLMNAVITPATGTIWGASDLKTDAQWQTVEHAALAVIAAGNLLTSGGAGEGEVAVAAEAEWQTYNNQMIDAARQVVEVVKARDEDKLFEVGNNVLYPPCEACHQKYQKR